MGVTAMFVIGLSSLEYEVCGMAHGRIRSALVASALAVCLCACGKSSYAQVVLDGGRGVKIVAENAALGSHGFTDAGLIVNEGEHVSVTPQLRGEPVDISLVDESGAEVWQGEVQGDSGFSVVVSPGTYGVSTSGGDVSGEVRIEVTGDAVEEHDEASSDETSATEDGSDDGALDEVSLDEGGETWLEDVSESTSLEDSY